MDYDHYQETEELISMFENTPLKHHGDALRDAMQEGSTGTEILMALRASLEELLRESEVNDIVSAKTKKLLLEINKSLD